MAFHGNGELVPDGGGDAIPLIRPVLTIGRRESCDICMRFPNVSGLHAELTYKDGHWLIRDLNSTNGLKVNGVRVPKKVLHDGDTITIAKKKFKIHYTETVTQRMEEIMEEEEDIWSQPLLERAGLENPRDKKRRGRPEDLGEDE
jgi:pSer/pThr/pTyr-binding forkhead associated (FHA) protein